EDMTEAWQPDRFHDEYRDDLLARIEAKIEAGKTHSLTEPAKGTRTGRSSAKIIDLTTMLQQSIESRAAKPAAAKPAKKAAATRRKTTAAKKATTKPSSRTTASARKSSSRKSTASKSSTRRPA